MIIFLSISLGLWNNFRLLWLENNALTAEEINAENHFWKVRPDSEGLVAYWKFNDNTGNVIKDHTEYGNNLIGDHTFLWVNVQLPQ